MYFMIEAQIKVSEIVRYRKKEKNTLLVVIQHTAEENAHAEMM